MWYMSKLNTFSKGDVSIAPIIVDGNWVSQAMPVPGKVYGFEHAGTEFTVCTQKDDSADGRGATNTGLVLTSFGCTNQPLHQLLADVHALYTSERAVSNHIRPWRQEIYTHGDEGGWRSRYSFNEKTLDRVALSDAAEAALRKDLQSFFSSESWYKSMGIAWTRGYLLHGPPGTGKTSVIKAISFSYKLDIYCLNLKRVHDDSALCALFNALPNGCMLVLEDVDCASSVVHSRAAVGPPAPTELGGSRVTLSCLLNLLDGISTCHGRVVVMTTNHVERLDAALIRPGRCDLHLELTNCCASQFPKLHRMYFEREPDTDTCRTYERLAGRMTPALVASVFLRYRDAPQRALAELCHLDTQQRLV